MASGHMSEHCIDCLFFWVLDKKGGEVEHEDNGKHSDEQREGEKDASDDDDDDVDDDDDNDDDDDDDDDSNCEAESGKEDDASDVESDGKMILERFRFAFPANAKRQTAGCCLS